MRNLKYYLSLFFTLIFITLGASAQDDFSDPELEKEMAKQRAEYQELVKSLGAEDLIDNPDIKNMVESGSINFDKLEQTVRKLQKQQAKKTLGGFQSPSIAELLKSGAVGTVSKMLTPFRSISEENLVKSIVNNLEEGTRTKTILKRHPKLVLLLARLLKSEKALPSMASILDDKNKLYTFLFINVALFVFLKLRKMIANRKNSGNKFYKKSFFDSLFGWVIATCIVLSIRVGIFVYFFGKEATPAWEVFKQTMFA